MFFWYYNYFMLLIPFYDKPHGSETKSQNTWSPSFLCVILKHWACMVLTHALCQTFLLSSFRHLVGLAPFEDRHERVTLIAQ